MKALLLTVLLAASSASVGQAYLNCDGVNLGSCVGIEGFIATGTTLMGTCLPQGDALMAAMTGATTQAAHDAAWTTFCTGSCFAGMAQLTAEMDCCVGIFGMLSSIKFLHSGCQKSTTNAGRYCGAELFPLSQVACQADNAGDCGALSSCEWSSDTGMCLFKPSQANLDAMCTDCNRAYFRNFATGGAIGVESHSQLSAIYDYACSQVDGEYCLLNQATEFGYRHVGQATAEDITKYCSASVAKSTTNRGCLRSLTASAARGLVRNARAAFEVCNSTDTECQAVLGSTVALAAALEKATASICSHDADGTNCVLKTGASLASSVCAATTAATGNCTGCDNESTAAINATGCCGAVTGTSGQLIASAAPTGRLLLASIAAASKNVNMSAPNLKLGLTALNTVLATGAVAASSNVLAGFATCPSFAGQFASWAASAADATQCPARTIVRAFDFTVYVAAAKFNACTAKSVAEDALVSDIAVNLGVSKAQITDVSNNTDAATGNLMVRVVVSLDSTAELDAVDARAFAGASFDYTTFGREIANSCPLALPYGLFSSLAVSGAYSSTPASGEAVTKTTTTTTTTTAAPTTRATVNGAASTSAVAGCALAAAVAVLMVL